MNYYMLDTSVILEFGLAAIGERFADSAFFITDIVWRELDGHKKGEDDKARAAREFFRCIEAAQVVENDILKPAFDFKNRNARDTIVMRDVGGVRLGVITPFWKYAREQSFDERIIRVAKNYQRQGLVLITLDRGFFGMAQNFGAQVMSIEVAQSIDPVELVRTCTACGANFSLTKREIARISAKGYELPRRCGECIRAGRRAGGGGCLGGAVKVAAVAIVVVAAVVVALGVMRSVI